MMCIFSRPDPKFAEMQPSSQLTRRVDILTNNSPITLGCTSRRLEKLLGASDDVHLF